MCQCCLDITVEMADERGGETDLSDSNRQVLVASLGGGLGGLFGRIGTFMEPKRVGGPGTRGQAAGVEGEGKGCPVV